MKKLLLATKISSALLTFVGAFAEENEFYINAQAGASFSKTTKHTIFNIKMHSKAIGNLGLGADYYVMDNLKADLTLNFLINPN